MASPIEKKIYGVFLISSFLISLPFIAVAVLLINQLTQIISEKETSRLESLAQKVFQQDIENRKKLLKIYPRASEGERKHIEKILGRVETIKPEEKLPEGFFQIEKYQGKIWLIYSDGSRIYRTSLPEETSEAYKVIESTPVLKEPTGIMNLRGYIPLLILIEILLLGLTLYLERRLAKTFALPLQEIERSTRRIALGDLETEIPHNTGIAEIDSLGESMEKMKTEIRNYREASAKAREAHLWKKIAREIAHEINNPLTAIKMSMQLLERDKGLPQNIKQKTTLVLQEVEKLKSSVEKILNRKEKLKLEPVNISREIQEIVELYRLSYPGKKIELEIEPDVKAMADPSLLRRILVNLLKNALEAADLVKVKAFKNEDRTTVLFMDNGPGIPEDKVNLLFKESFTTKEKGSGIGLNLSYSFARSMGGNISYRRENGWTIFELTLPSA